MKVDIEFNSAGHVPSPGILEAAQIAEEKGFGAVWKGESNSRDPVVLLAAIAARTSRIELGTAVYHIFARSPVTTAYLAATLNELSRGRFILGIGCANPALASWHGTTYDKPIGRMREYFTIVRKAYAGEKMEAQGKYYGSRAFKLSFHTDQPLRLYMAALGPQMTRLAGEIGDGVITNMANPEQVAAIAASVRAGAAEVGRDPSAIEVVVKVRCAINDNLTTARTALKNIATFYSLADGYKQMLADRMGLAKEIQAINETWKAKGFKEAARQVTDEMMTRVPMIPATSPAEVKAGLKPYFAAGATRVIVPFVPSTDHPIEETLEFVRSW
jgi:alkanesulfonate monooxygenase SsuD/methylene tetrahydromethanopterin reductase-like flavin-dependent oxidoreductase (luciferase family)